MIQREGYTKEEVLTLARARCPHLRVDIKKTSRICAQKYRTPGLTLTLTSGVAALSLVIDTPVMWNARESICDALDEIAQDLFSA